MDNFLYHWAPRTVRESIERDGLVGKNGGRWCIYLAREPGTWSGMVHDSDLWRVDITGLCTGDFSCIDPGVDEVLYWGKGDGVRIMIPGERVERIG